MNATDTARAFDAIYREHTGYITRYILRHLFTPDRDLADDLTSETFLLLWRKMSDGLVVEHPRALLQMMAGRVIADHFRRASSRETAMDFGASNVTEAASGAADTPHLAGLFEDLESAKDVLARAAETYRAAYRRASLAKTALGNSLSPEAVARAGARLESAGQVREAALEAFAAAGRAVALVRAAWNTGAGELHGLGLGAGVAQMAGAR
ncbi:RNA polymerase sigma factor [Kitasatospora sp. NPDC056327]|uniref:RNA polymerase sigma factor n=1 Tax=Kitasatospora sp. NPDC056327 TaxID=3345785 RepID=UPI0035DAAF66